MTKKHVSYLLIYFIFFYIFVSLCSCSSEKPEITRPLEQGAHESSGKISYGAETKEVTFRPITKYETTKKEAKGSSINNPPIVEKAKLQLETINNTDVIKVIADGKDIDGDVITFKYEWAKNGESVSEGDTISGFKRGDKLSVKITPFDGKDYGHPKILTTEIRNTTPKISGYKEIKFDGNIYTYQIKATDPDGDTLTYNLKQAPEGMIIDKSTGSITWKVGEKDTGRHPVSVQITDGHGGEVIYNFEVTIGFEGSR